MSVQLTENFALLGDELDLNHAEAIKTAGVALIDREPQGVRVDLGGLERANSVTVAVLLAWYRHATLHQKSVVFENLSEDMLNIIEFSGLSRVLLPE